MGQENSRDGKRCWQSYIRIEKAKVESKMELDKLSVSEQNEEPTVKKLESVADSFVIVIAFYK
ncbi:hypothetical protein BH18THE2_BH18THE2_07490 [soil metagenome]